MVSMHVAMIFLFRVSVEEVEWVEATIGRPLATFPSKKIDSPLHIHITPKLLISHNQTTHALCDNFPLSSLFIFRIIILFFTVFIKDDARYIFVVRGIKRKSFLPVRVGHPKFFP